jgi:enoyl-CoA hydratase
MWIYRLGLTKAKEYALTGKPLSGVEAAAIELVNRAYENMGLASTQTLGPILDGLMRNTPDAKRFIELAKEKGVPAAVAERDALFGDYSQAPADQKPDPGNVIEP